MVTALTVAGCGGDDDHSATDTAGAGTASAQATSESAPESAGEEAPQAAPATGEGANGETTPGSSERAVRQRSPGRGCLTGRYVSRSFVSKRSFDSPVGPARLSGHGRGLGLEFRDAGWTMRGVGHRPMRGKVFGISGTLRVNGSVSGRLVRARGERLRFLQTSSRGTVTLSGLGQSFELPVSTVARTVVPDGRARVTCRGRRLTIDSASGVLRLARP